MGIDGMDLLLSLVFAVVVIIVARFVSRWLRGRVVRSLSRQEFGRNGAVLVGRLVSIAVYLAAAMVILSGLGVSSTGILAFLGAFSVALGLALQDVFRNFFSGILLLMERPFKVGDHIKVRDIEGEVQGIDVRTTIVKIASGSVVMVPNSIVFSEVLSNRARSGVRRVDLTLVAKGMSVMAVESHIHQALAELEYMRKPIPAPVVRSIGDEQVVMEMSILLDEAAEAPGAVMAALAKAPNDASIEVSRP